MTRNWTFASALTAAGLLAAPGFAGSAAEPVIEPVPVAPAPVYNTGGDWTGFYGGLQLGYGDVSGKDALDGVDGNGGIYGVHAGYNYDFGTFVLGGELDYDKMDIDIGNGAATVDDVTRFKIKGGYDLGRTLIYATAGAARVNTTAGDDTGPFYGLGASYQVTDRFLLGGEVLQHNFSDLGGTAGLDADATTFTVRASFRF